jgi:translation initiation factor IF-2
LIDTVRKRVAALLPPNIETRVLGEATVQQLFEIKVKKEVTVVAGCRVSNGTIAKGEKARVMRLGESGEREVVFEGNIDTLKQYKKDVSEVRKGTECGIAFEGFGELKEGDEVVSFSTFEVAREL